MYKYRNEAHFSGALVKHLRSKGWFVQRIETGSTGRGVPDIYCISPDGRAMWLELKRVHQSLRGRDRAVVPWRPGQQAWLRQVTRLKQTCYTIAAFDDCFVLIPHNAIWSNDIILLSKCTLFFTFNALTSS